MEHVGNIQEILFLFFGGVEDEGVIQIRKTRCKKGVASYSTRDEFLGGGFNDFWNCHPELRITHHEPPNPWKNKGLGHLRNRLFTIKTSGAHGEHKRFDQRLIPNQQLLYIVVEITKKQIQTHISKDIVHDTQKTHNFSTFKHRCSGQIL